ncbi:MAG: tRNA (N6-threonylcarbamoyladenosine(37)-N6)-methyltransferase TrmO [Candidatus Fermentibacteria bacterium]
MNDDVFVFRPIGIIHSPHREVSKIPIQPVFCNDIDGRIVLETEYAEGLIGLEGFSHIYLFYYFHESREVCLRMKPYLSDQEQGIFASRAPHRPNKLGMSLVRLLNIEDNVIHVKDIDILNGTPLFDIKPFIQRFDSREIVRSGWQEAIPDDIAVSRGAREYDPEDI